MQKRYSTYSPKGTVYNNDNESDDGGARKDIASVRLYAFGPILAYIAFIAALYMGVVVAVTDTSVATRVWLLVNVNASCAAFALTGTRLPRWYAAMHLIFVLGIGGSATGYLTFKFATDASGLATIAQTSIIVQIVALVALATVLILSFM